MEDDQQKIKGDRTPKLKTKEEIILYVTSLKKRAIKLRKEADNSEVILKSDFLGYATTVKLSEVSLEMQKPLFQDMTEELKEELLKNYKCHLTSLVSHFSLVLRIIKIRPEFWNEFENKEKEFIILLEGFEEIGPKFCRKKSEKIL